MSKVDLPEPERPVHATHSPRRTCRSRPYKTGQGDVAVTVGALDAGRVEDDVCPFLGRRDGRRPHGLTHP